MSPPHAPSHTAAPRLTATGLACRRGTRLLFKELDLDVDPGEIVWVRGQNGSGKTSLLRLVAGLSAPEQGRVLCDGVSVRQAARPCRLVYIGHANALKEDLTVSESLEFLLRIHGRPSDRATVLGALERLGLLSRRNAMVRTLSQGQRRRVALARLAVDDGAAALWLLDEPFDALDIDGIERLNGLLNEHVRRGGSVLLTSHLGVSTAMLRPREVNLDPYS